MKWIILSVMLLAALMTIVSAENETTNQTSDDGNENETIDNGDGNETVDDSDGNETIDDSDGNETIDDGDENETIDDSDGNETVEDDDGNETVDDSDENETIDEVDAFHTTLGARIRLLQLESSISRNIAWGEAIVAAIEGKNSSADVSELEPILSELAALESEVSSVDPASGEDAAQQFVALKKKAISLTQEFRKTARGMLKISDVEGLRKRLQTLKLNETKTKVGRIHELQREFNARMLNETLTAMDISNPQLANEFANGDAGAKDIKAYLKNATSNMSREEKKQAFFALKEQVSKRNIFLRSVAENRTEWKQEKIAAITTKRVAHVEGLIKKVENRSNKITARIEERLGEENLSENQKEKGDARIEKVENKTAKITDRLSDRIENITNKSAEMQDKVANRGNGKGHGGDD